MCYQWAQLACPGVHVSTVLTRSFVPREHSPQIFANNSGKSECHNSRQLRSRCWKTIILHSLVPSQFLKFPQILRPQRSDFKLHLADFKPRHMHKLLDGMPLTPYSIVFVTGREKKQIILLKWSVAIMARFDPLSVFFMSLIN